MNLILLSGGSGKRLWPLSNDVRSKQFIKFFKKEDGTYESMLQKIYGQIKKVDSESVVTVATSAAQMPMIVNQLGKEVGVSVEPCRRDTFPAIALSTAYLHDVKGVSEDEVVVVCPVDPYVEDEYFEAIKELSDIAEKGESNLVLMGIEPTYPSEKYGYIIPNENAKVSRVESFKEKPTEEVAMDYIAQGALWNCGVFAYKLKYVLQRAHELIDFTDYYDLYEKYETLQKISFDYAVVEHEPEIQVMRFLGVWKDLGTWDALVDTVDQNVGNVIKNDTCENTHIINELDVPILGVGLENLVIVAGAEGILVSSIEKSDTIKSYVDALDTDIRYEETEWGSTRRRKPKEKYTNSKDGDTDY